MTLGELLVASRTFATVGDDFLRQSSSEPEFSAVMAKSINLGHDAAGLNEKFLPYLEDLECHLAALRQAWTGIFLRLLVVLMMAIGIRFFLTRDLPAPSWDMWDGLDRLCVVTGALLGLAVLAWLQELRRVSASRSSNSDILTGLYAGYLTSGNFGAYSPEILSELRTIRSGELRGALDGESRRQRLFLTGIRDLGRDSERNLSHLVYVSLGVELGSVLLLGLTFDLIPLLVWLQTASGT